MGDSQHLSSPDNKNPALDKSTETGTQSESDSNPANSSFLSVLDGVSLKHKQASAPKQDAVDMIPFGYGSVKKDLSLKYKYASNFTTQAKPSSEFEDEVSSSHSHSFAGQVHIHDSDSYEDFPASEDFDPETEFCDVDAKPVQEAKCSGTLGKTWSEINKPIVSRQIQCSDEHSSPSAVKTDSHVLTPRNTETRQMRGKKRQNPGDIETDIKPRSKRLKTSDQSARKEQRCKGRATRSQDDQEEEEWVNSGVSEVGWQTDEVGRIILYNIVKSH